MKPVSAARSPLPRLPRFSRDDLFRDLLNRYRALQQQFTAVEGELRLLQKQVQQRLDQHEVKKTLAQLVDMKEE